MKGRILMALFALPFFSFGVWMGWSIGSAVYDTVRMGSWVPATAQLTAGGYETHSGDDSDTYEAFAEYSYSFGGRSYTGDRVGISRGADNIGSYQQDTGRHLADALANNHDIRIWVDPDDPAEAVIDRSIRWGLMGFKLIFVLLFGGFGGGLLYFTWRTPPEKDTTDPRYASTPWLLNDAWQTPEIRSGSRASMFGVWGFAVFWNLISAPLPFLLYDEVVNKQNYPALAGLLFTAVGIGLLTWAVRRTLEWRRFGPTPVTLDPFPGSIGGHVGGTIDLNVPYDARNEFQLTLTNLKSYISSSGKDRERRETAKWQDMIVAHSESTGSGTRLTFRFDVPEGLRESDALRDDDTYYAWRLDLAGELEGTDIDRSFDIPVFATATESRSLSKLAVQQGRQRQTARAEKAVRDMIRFTTGINGRSLYFPMGRNFWSALVGLVVGGVFAAVGAFLFIAEGQRVFGSVFGGAGALVAIAAFYAMTNSLQVSRTADGFSTLRRWLGVPVKRRHMGRHEFHHFEKNSRYQQQGGGKHVMYYTVYAVDNGGRKIAVGEGFRGGSQAEAAIRVIGQELGLAGIASRNGTQETDSSWDPARLLSRRESGSVTR